jgi:hypothetical protein
MSRFNWPRSPSDAPLALWGYVSISVCAAVVQMLVVGGVTTWILAVPGSIAFGYMLLHGLRVFRQIGLVLCFGSVCFAPAARGPLWLIAFPLLGLVLLLLPASRDFCINNGALEPADP